MNKYQSTGSLRTLVYFFITEVMLTDIHSKGCLLTTMVHRAHRLLSTPAAFADECSKLCFIFLNLDYPFNLINSSSINKFLHDIDNIDAPKNASDDTPSVMIQLPFKDQNSANSVERQMHNLSANTGVLIKPVFQSKEIGQVLSLREKKPPIVSNQCLVYKFQCRVHNLTFTPTHRRRLIHRNRQAHRGAWANEVCFRGQTICYFEIMQIEV